MGSFQTRRRCPIVRRKWRLSGPSRFWLAVIFFAYQATNRRELRLDVTAEFCVLGSLFLTACFVGIEFIMKQQPALGLDCPCEASQSRSEAFARAWQGLGTQAVRAQA